MASPRWFLLLECGHWSLIQMPAHDARADDSQWLCDQPGHDQGTFPAEAIVPAVRLRRRSSR